MSAIGGQTDDARSRRKGPGEIGLAWGASYGVAEFLRVRDRT